MLVIFPVSHHENSFQSLLLRKPSAKKESEPVLVNIKVDDYSWLDELKANLIEKKEVQRVWLVAEDTPCNGVVGLVNCLRKEQGGEKKGGVGWHGLRATEAARGARLPRTSNPGGGAAPRRPSARARRWSRARRAANQAPT